MLALAEPKIIILLAESWEQMAWLQQTWYKKTVVLGLLIHFCLWWALSAWFWATSWSRHLALISVIAPLSRGIFYLQGGFWFAGILGMMVFIALAGLSFLALRTRTRWIVLLAHVSILMYWFFSSLLISFDI